MTKRRRLTNAEFAKLWLQQQGKCACGCGERLVVGEVDLEHSRPLWGGGTDTLDNITLYLRQHHKAKSAEEATRRAKADRQQLFHTTGRSHAHKVKPIQSRGFDKRLRKRMNGQVERVGA